MSMQVSNKKFVIEIDRERDDIVIYPRAVYYPGQPASYYTHAEAADLRDLLDMALRMPERQETKRQPVVSTDTDGVTTQEHGSNML